MALLRPRREDARLVEAGHVRVNGARSDNAAKLLRQGDVLTIALERRVRVLRVVADGERRGPFSEASLLFEELGATRDVGVPHEAGLKVQDPSSGWDDDLAKTIPHRGA